MRTIRVATITFASLLGLISTTYADIGQLAPRIDAGNPALGTYSGRASLCRAHLLTHGYPYAYLYNTRRSSRGLVGACARQLYYTHRDVIRQRAAARLANR